MMLCVHKEVEFVLISPLCVRNEVEFVLISSSYWTSATKIVMSNG